MICTRADTFKPARAYSYITLFVQLAYSFLVFVQVCSLHLACTNQSKSIFPSIPKSDLTLAEAAHFYSCYLPEEVFPTSLLFTTPSRLAVLTRRVSSIRLASQPSHRLTPYLTLYPHSYRFTFSAVLLRLRPKRESAGGAFMRPRFQSFSIVLGLTPLRAGAIRLLRPYLRGCYRITFAKVQPFFILSL